MRTLFSWLLVFVAVGSIPAAAQTDQTGMLEGRVVDANGLPIAQAEVRVALEGRVPTHGNA